ncbi:Nin1 binding protein [Coelomomyces lativittatus]|nr:Nin1 binding protein [Coelomomyces lativittatus]KAJ1503641.1 Nin1 binding protein [Coelomomyces lativittatus]KAJ1514459.1 Nin1 binding protein [Coelomomyces lativittatus]
MTSSPFTDHLPSKQCHTLVLDTGAFLHHGVVPSRMMEMAEVYVTLPEVLDEIKDRSSQFYLKHMFPFEFKVLSPTQQAFQKVIQLTKQTGDYPSLSVTDLKVLAVVLMLQEKESEHEKEMKNDKGNLEERVSMLHEVKENIKPPTSTPWVHGLPGFINRTTTPKTKKINEEKTLLNELEEEDEDEEEEEEEEEDATWLTYEHLDEAKQRAVGLIPMPTTNPEKEKTIDSMDSSSSSFPVPIPSNPLWIPKVACMTTDFAMQNALLQMNLPLMSIEGRRIQAIKNWLLRCHACFTTTMNMEKQFCPKCGNATLLRTSYSIEQGQLQLHLKKNFHYRLRGTKYKVPNSQGNTPALILREDQKEYVTQTKAYQRHLRHAAKESASAWMTMTSGFSSSCSLGGGNGRGGEGPPVVGFGRRNPNVARRSRK